MDILMILLEADIDKKKKNKILQTAVGGVGIGAISGTMASIPNTAAILGIPHALGGKKETFVSRGKKLWAGIMDSKTKLSQARPMQRGHERTVRVWSKAMGIKPPKVTGQGKVDISKDLGGIRKRIAEKVQKKLGRKLRPPAGAFYNQRDTPQGIKHVVSIAPGWEKAIAHEVGHAKAYSHGPLRTKIGSLTRASGKLAPFVGAGMLASDNEKVNKAAPAAAGVAASGTVLSELNANKNI